MIIGIISIFPEMFRTITDFGIIGKAIRNNLLTIKVWNPREFAKNKYNSIDDRPYGGGPGMLMTAQPLCDAIKAAKQEIKGDGIKVIYLSPQGYRLDQSGVKKLILNRKLILVCGRYKGIDERIIQTEIDEEWSIGDYVLSGGELPAMVLIDSISRFIPGVLNQKSSLSEDSFYNGLLGCPHYTRPKYIKGIKVPSVLLSGNHSEIYCWRLKQSLGKTWLKRPDLLKHIILTDEQKKLLIEFKNEYQQS